MRKLRSLFAVAALAAAFGLLLAVPAASSGAEEKEPTREDKEKLAEKGAEALKDMATAYGLIDILRREGRGNAIAMITAVDILVDNGPGDLKKDGVEGAVKGDAPEYHAQMRDLLKEAATMPGGKSDEAKKMSEEVMEKIGKSEKLLKGGRGTATGHTSTSIVVDKMSSATVTRLFMGGTACTATVTKLVNVGVPLVVDVIAPDGSVFYHNAGNSLAVSWRVPKGPDAKYTIKVTNNHSVSVAVKVETN